MATDGSQKCVNEIDANIYLNSLEGDLQGISSAVLQWGHLDEELLLPQDVKYQYDLIIGADVVGVVIGNFLVSSLPIDYSSLLSRWAYFVLILERHYYLSLTWMAVVVHDDNRINRFMMAKQYHTWFQLCDTSPNDLKTSKFSLRQQYAIKILWEFFPTPAVG